MRGSNRILPALAGLIVAASSALSQAPAPSSLSSTSAIPPGWLWFTNGQALSDADRQRLEQLEKHFSMLPPLPANDQARLQQLEKQGSVSKTNYEDLMLAPRTSWWGKPPDPAQFWANRPIWMDESATEAARQRGRMYPPIPTHLPALIAKAAMPNRSNVDIVPLPWGGGLDSGAVIPYRSTQAENDFWNWFWRKMPKPPETLEREQFDVASSILNGRRPPPTLPNRPQATLDSRAETDLARQRRADSEAFRKKRAQETIGVPEEALTEEALFWCYVMRKQKAIEQIRADARARTPTPWLDKRIELELRQSAVDTNHLTAPMTGAQIETANRWKIAYLSRLRREQIDEAYINAYLKAWKLPASALTP